MGAGAYTYGASVEDALMKLQYDLYYIKNLSLALDLYIIFSTIKTVCSVAKRSGVRGGERDDGGRRGLFPRQRVRSRAHSRRLAGAGEPC